MSGNGEQAGLWFAINDQKVFKLVWISRSSGAANVQAMFEVHLHLTRFVLTDPYPNFCYFFLFQVAISFSIFLYRMTLWRSRP